MPKVKVPAGVKWMILVPICVAAAVILLGISDADTRQAMRGFQNRLKDCRALLVKANTQVDPENTLTNFSITITNPLLIGQLTSLAQENASRLRLKHASPGAGFGSMLCIAVYSPTPTTTNLLFSIVGDSVLFIDSNHYCTGSSDLHKAFLRAAFSSSNQGH